jgi:hypothetical protein
MKKSRFTEEQMAVALTVGQDPRSGIGNRDRNWTIETAL